MHASYPLVKKTNTSLESAADSPYLAFSFGVSVTSPSKPISISQCSGWIPIPKSCIS